MKTITITAKIKLYPTSVQMVILNKTLSVIRDVLNLSLHSFLDRKVSAISN